MGRVIRAAVARGPSAREWAVTDITCDLDDLQFIVGGPIECLQWAGLELVCNEEGKINGSRPTVALVELREERGVIRSITHDVIHGPLIMHGSLDSEGRMLGLTPLQEAGLERWIERGPGASRPGEYLVPVEGMVVRR